MIDAIASAPGREAHMQGEPARRRDQQHDIYKEPENRYEAPGVEPFYVGPKAKEHAIGYATERLKFSGGEVRVVDAAGTVERVITGIVSG